MRKSILIAAGILLLIASEVSFALDSQTTVRKRMQCAAEFSQNHALTQQCAKSVVRHYCDKMYYPKYIHRCKTLYHAAKFEDLSEIKQRKTLRLMFSCINLAIYKNRIIKDYQSHRTNNCKLKPRTGCFKSTTKKRGLTWILRCL